MGTEFCNRRAVVRFSVATLLPIGTVGCLNGRSATSQTVTMTDDFTFDPETVTIEPGQTVTWTNTSAVDHTVTAYEDEIPEGGAYFASGDFESEDTARSRMTDGLIVPDEEYEHTFEEPGTYEYYCVPHETSEMVGTVHVE